MHRAERQAGAADEGGERTRRAVVTIIHVDLTHYSSSSSKVSAEHAERERIFEQFMRHTEISFQRAERIDTRLETFAVIIFWLITWYQEVRRESISMSLKLSCLKWHDGVSMLADENDIGPKKRRLGGRWRECWWKFSAISSVPIRSPLTDRFFTLFVHNESTLQSIDLCDSLSRVECITMERKLYSSRIFGY